MNVTDMKSDNQETGNVISFMSIIERASLNPDVDVQKLSQLYEMHERTINREAEKVFRAEFADAQAEIEPIARKHNNKQTNSKYVKLEDIIKEITPILIKHGFGMTFDTDQSHLENHYRVTCLLTHKEGHCEPYKVDIPMDNKGVKGTANKTDTHAFGSTMSYGRRYLTVLIWNIATPDDNDGNRPIEYITDEQADELKKIAADLDVDVKKFCAVGGVASIDEIAAHDYQNAKNMLLSKGKQ